MIVKVHEHKLEIEKSPVNELEVNITKIKFEFDEGIEGTKEAYFTFKGHTYKVLIVNDECDIPNEVLTEKGQVELGVVVFTIEDEETIQRYNPSPAYFNTWEGSLKEADNTEPITPTDKEQIEAIVQEVQAEMNNLDIDAEKVDTITTITITHKDGTVETVQVLDGEQGPQGEPGVPGAVKFLIVNELPTEDIQTDAIYLVPSNDPTTQDLYLEYMYINNAWELLGQKQITVDLTDYVKNTDYATADKGGVVKINSSYGGYVSSSGLLYTTNDSYATYQNRNANAFIGKGTLENVITGKGLTTKSYVDGLVGDINTALDTINGENI